VDRAGRLRYKRATMEPTLRTLLHEASSDPGDDRFAALGDLLARTMPQDPEARTWLGEYPGLPRTRRRIWAAVGLRLWDMGRLKPAPAPAPSATRSRKEPPAGPIENWRDLWSAPVSRLRGCGPATSEALAGAGIHNCADLLFQLPRGYLDFRTVVPVAGCREKTPQLFFLHVDKVQRIGRKCFATAHDDSGEMQLMWFQFVPGLGQTLRKGADLYFIGEPHFHGPRRQLVHPRVLTERPSGVGVVYPATGGLGNGLLQRLMTAALAFVPDTRTLPEEAEGRHDLWPLRDALACIHRPEADRLGAEDLRLLQDGTHPAQRRLLFEEVFGLQCAIGLRCGQGDQLEACRVVEDRTPEYADVFGFTLTAAQRRVIGELLADLGAGHPMRRLLQGDVGSGKTAVAFVCAAHVIGIGRQVAVMAPTTLLAEQQFRSFSAWCARFGWQAALVTSDTPTAARESTLALLEAGKIHLIVGTHSLIQERIQFSDLGLVVVDEQHRFGVDQRARLVNKGQGGERPHLLVMTATPIPRSLALTVYGDLESSRIDELPPGRPPVVTRAYHTKTQKKQALARFAQAVSGEGKGFVIVPLIDAAEDPERASVEVAVSYIREQFPELPLGVLHGRMTIREREPVLRDFEQGRLRVLVATTVVEVGMDIPDANYMIILEADRFGLAQLHQLRGRIGRRPAPAAECMLFGSAKPTEDGRERIAWMERTSSGFDLAEADLAMRGPGDMLGGKRQAGLFKPAWIRNLELLQVARAEARELLARDPGLDAHPDLAFVVRTRFGEELFDETGG
jgi:ATP-dependent DNA helicase RecG